MKFLIVLDLDGPLAATKLGLAKSIEEWERLKIGGGL